MGAEGLEMRTEESLTVQRYWRGVLPEERLRGLRESLAQRDGGMEKLAKGFGLRVMDW
jgi:hypothetical protein